jgi:exportin-1
MIYRAQIKQFVEGLFLYNNDLVRFKTHLRDFLISLKEFAGDNTELFQEDRELAQQAAKDAELERAKKVGGLIKPAELDQDDEL